MTRTLHSLSLAVDPDSRRESSRNNDRSARSKQRERQRPGHSGSGHSSHASSASTSAAARSPDRTAPSMYPHHALEVSVPAQWIGPAEAASACPYLVHVFGPNSAP